MTRRGERVKANRMSVRGAVLIEMMLLISLVALSCFVVIEDLGIRAGCKLTKIYRPNVSGDMGPKEIMVPCCVGGILLCGPNNYCMCLGGAL